MDKNHDELSALIEKFRNTNNLTELENIADQLGTIGNERAIESLLYRLGDNQVQEDPDVEDAVCDALVKLGIMTRIGNLNFRFINSSLMKKDFLAIIEKYKRSIPNKYFVS